MPAPLNVDREQVRMLVLAVGVREAARQMGLNEKTVLHWSHTGNWLAHTRPQPAPVLPLSMQPRSVVSVKPADALQNTLEERFAKSKLGLSKWLVKSSEHLGSLDGEEALANHQPAVSAASVLAKLCPPKAAVSMRISMFGSHVDGLEALHEGPVIDLVSEGEGESDAVEQS